MNQFQAKNIQKIVGIPKYRYEYIASKIGIVPEVEEVEDTGHVHLYSFKNLLEFAFVHSANNLGLGPKAVKEMLSFLSNNVELHNAGLFDPGAKINVLLHYAYSKDGKVFKLSGPGVSEQGRKGVYFGKGFDKVKKMLKETSKKKAKINIPTEELKALTALSLMDLNDFDGYVTVNLGIIKDHILQKLKD